MSEIRGILYKNAEGQVEDLLGYVERLEEQRDKALAQVREWNKDSEIQIAEEKKKEAYARLNRGFAPDDEQWEQIKAWEEKHARKYHKPSKPDHLTKYMPNSPHYEYCFGYTHLGTMGSVVCASCRRKAIEKSKGNMELLDKLIKENGISFFFGEV